MILLSDLPCEYATEIIRAVWCVQVAGVGEAKVVRSPAGVRFVTKTVCSRKNVSGHLPDAFIHAVADMSLRVFRGLMNSGTGLLLAIVFTSAATPGAITVFAQDAVPADHAERMRQGTELFRDHIRETLRAHCLDCHGGQSTKADFDLSTREALMNSGFVGKTAEDSHLMRLIAHAEEPHMPFKKPQLSATKIAQIRQWIDLGAPYDKPLKEGTAAAVEMQVTDQDRQFWSFRPLSTPDVPEVTDRSWCRTPVDQFILSKQEQLKLHPNQEANRRTLIRRAYLDLLGLPPTPEETDAFVNDPDTQAWPKLIDRLLDSPHYGERWARHWLDVARFAESHGYEQDYDRPFAYHYRDFLIRAFNSDMPWMQMLSWQLAGDELAPEDPLALMATGFLGAGAFPTQLTENEFESARYDELDDMVTTTGVAFLGLSVGCARCHDHKFDPIPANDYYRMAATFASAIRSEIPLDLDPEENRMRREAWVAEGKRLSSLRDSLEREALPGRFQEWLTKWEPSDNRPVWEMLRVISAESDAGTGFTSQEDGSWLATGNAPVRETITIVAEADSRTIRSLRLEALTHSTLPQQGPGRAGNGNFVLGNVQVVAAPRSSRTSLENVHLVNARASHEQNADSLSVTRSIDSDPVTGWAVDGGGIGHDQAAVFDFEKPIEYSDGAVLTITMSFQHPNPQHTLGRFRVSVGQAGDLKPQPGIVGPDLRITEALQRLKNNPNQQTADWKTGLAWFATMQSDWQQLTQQLQQHEQKGPELKLTTVMVTSEGRPPMKHNADGRGFPHFYPEVYRLKRGDVHQKQQVVSSGFLQVLMPAETPSERWFTASASQTAASSSRRSAMAGWMTDSRDGAGSLVARVIVNRLWHHHFGRGIVASPNDFGISGERPSHPELLEWLASDFVSHGWTLKRVHRLIMNSHVYMQSADFDDERALTDRENVNLWRWTPRRLEAEAIRDSLLSVSGQLDKTMYGPGSLDQNMNRRSVYFFIKRSELIPMMMLFDWPEHLVSIGQRSTTTIAPQALMFLNSPQGRKYSAAFAARLPSNSVADAVIAGYRIALSRQPTDNEQRLLTAFIEQQTALYAAESKDDARRLALTDFCQTLFSMNELIYIE